MGSFTGKKIFSALFSVFLVVILSCATVACSQVVPDIVQADYSVVFDYKDAENLPSSRLCVFVASESDVRRYSAIRLVSKETGLIWETGDILKLQESDRQWSGNANFVPPEKEVIPSGVYEVTFINADEEEDSLEFKVKYNEAYYETLSVDVPELMKKQNGINKIAIYDADGKMLYFGNRNADLLSVRGIWNNYREAEIFQDIWCSADLSVMCIMPEEAVSLE